MAKIVTLYSGSGLETTYSFDSFDYSEFSELSDQNGELRIVETHNTTQENPVIVREALSNVANVYNGTDIDPSAYAPVKSGKSLLLQIQQNAIITDSNDPTYKVILPLVAHLVLKVPNSDLLDTDHIRVLLDNLFATTFVSNGTSGERRFAKLFKGALKPDDLG